MPSRWSIAALLAVWPGAASAQDAGVEFFERKIRPALAEHCQRCHGAEKTKGHLRLDSRASLLKGGDTGPAVKVDEPAQSLLLKAIGYEDPELRMPPRGKLPDEVIADLRRWIEMGAPWPDDAVNAKVAVSKEFDLKARGRHWSLQPLRSPPPPKVARTEWVQTPVDRFILAKLEENKLTPALPADPYTLLRRLYFDITGLPPTPEQIETFVREYKASAKPQAVVEKLVDRLLASPHYGERWGRHWLDLVRYAETMGHEFDFEIPEAWRYRDYVVRAFNEDLPYDRFVTEHIAGDLLPEPRWHSRERTNESILATGFWWLGEAKHAPVDSRADQADRVDNQIDVFGKAFLGLTVACARCHDHKFDAISTNDYYALAGYLQSSRQDRVFLDHPERRRAALDGLVKIHAEIQAALPEFDAEKAAPAKGAWAHFRGNDWGGWFISGEAFGPRPSRAGDVMIDANQNIRLLAPGWAHSGRLSLKLEGSLRSPTFTIDKRYVHYRIAGKNAKCNVILNGLQLIREPIYGRLAFTVDHETPQWRTQDLDMWRGQRAYIEVLDDGTGYAALEQVVVSDDPTPPRAEADDNAPEIPATDDLARLLQQFNKQQAALPPPTRALGIADGNGIDEHVFIRGNSKNLGPVTPRRFLEVFGGEDVAAPKYGSGRLDLARQLVDPSRTPIVPRVIVNRVWKHHFGEGIVRSPDDFGVLGQEPTHPELLDHLASEFVINGWSIKKLHKMILLSATYQQASFSPGSKNRVDTAPGNGDAVHPGAAPARFFEPGLNDAAAVDPDNKLLHRMPIRRLDAEAIRDALLTVSGRLDRTVGGPSVPVHLTPFMVGRGRPGVSGPLDGHGRRSLYISVRRNFLTPMFTAFDYPTPFSTMGRRSVSNVPAQALTMLNNPLVAQQAELWAKDVVAERHRTPAQRIERMYLASLGRPPSQEEAALALAFVRHYSGADRQPWTELAHVMFNLKEFIFVE
jgi:cytochrome c553